MRYVARVGGERDGGREMALEIGRRVADRTAGDEGEAARGARRDVRVDGRERRVEARLVGEPPGGDEPHRAGAATASTLVLTIDGRRLEAIVTREKTGYAVTIGGRIYAVALEDPQRRAAARTGAILAGRVEVRAVMPGKIAAVLVEAGQQVAQGQGLIVVEAMKMENEIVAPRAGRVSSVNVRPGETVEAGAPLLAVE